MLKFFAIMQVALVKPYRWVENIKKYADKENKNSFFLYALLRQLSVDRRTGFNTEQEMDELEILIAYIHAKHEKNIKKPSATLIQKLVIENKLNFGPRPEQ